MSTNELPPENRTANQLTIPENPPVHPEPLLNSSKSGTMSDEPPQTRLLLSGLDREEITADFLDDLHDLAEDYDLSVDAISVEQPNNE